MKINRTVLKLIAVIAMTLDHVAFAFLRYDTVAFQLMRLVGKITAPVMCYLLVEGFLKTSSRKKYLERLLIFAIIAYVPYILLGHPMVMLGYGSIWQLDFNMLFTLALCLVMLMAMEKLWNREGSVMEKVVYVTPVLLVTIILSFFCDWLVFAPLFVANFYLCRDKKNLMNGITALICIGFCIYTFASFDLYLNNSSLAMRYSFYSLGIFLNFPLLGMYNHEKGKFDLKYFFYAYYPFHLIVIDLIKYLTMVK